MNERATMNDTTVASNARSALAEQLRRKVDEVEGMLKSAVRGGDRRLDEARMRIEHQLRKLRLQLDDLEDHAVYGARHAARSADQAVHAHPYRAAGIGAAVGLLVGLLLLSRR